jgi:DNA primase
MSWRTKGKPAVGIGGVAFTKMQADIIRRSPIERLYLAPDNDAAGEKLRESVLRELRGSVELFNVYMPAGIKDANEALMAGCLSKITVEKYERTFGLRIDKNARSL